MHSASQLINARYIYRDLGYSTWKWFHHNVEKCQQLINSGLASGEITSCKTKILIGSGAKREVPDYLLDEAAVVRWYAAYRKL